MGRKDNALARAEKVISIQNELISRLHDLLGCYERGLHPPPVLTDRITELRRQLTST